MCSRNTVRESLRISFFCGGEPICKVVRRPENTYDMFAWVTRSNSLERQADLSIQSKFTDLILSFQVSYGNMNILFASGIFLFMADYRNLHTSDFFPVICWSYLRTEISVTLSIGN